MEAIVTVFSNFLFFSGPTALCAQQGINDLSSAQNMIENGWDLQNSYQDKRLVLTENACWNLLNTIDKFKWMIQPWTTSTISTSFWGDGRATLDFGNCNVEGRVTVLLDGKEIGNSSIGNKITSVSFNVANGSTLAIEADDRSVIRLYDLRLECGKQMSIQNHNLNEN